jgi:hypothetical protein
MKGAVDMRKTILVIALFISVITAWSSVNVSFLPGVWVGPNTGSDDDENMHKIGALGAVSVGFHGKTLSYEGNLNYRSWAAAYTFNTLNLDNYLIINVTTDNPIDLYLAPFITFGLGWFSNIPEYDEAENYHNAGGGGKFGIKSTYANGRGLVDLYFWARGGVVFGESEGLTWLGTTKIGTDIHIPIAKSVRVIVSIGGLSDNFYIRNGMASYDSFISPYLYMGPEFLL